MRTDGLIFQVTAGVLTLTAGGALAYQHMPLVRHERPVDTSDYQEEAGYPS